VTTAALRHARYVVTENPITLVAFSMLVTLLFLALVGPALAPYDPLKSDTANTLKPPSARHWFGTDQLGRDMLSRVMVATRLDMAIAFSSVALSFAVGSLAGACAGVFGGWTERIVSRISDTIMAFPLFVMAPLARMTRASMLGVLGSDFIRTARASGLSSRTVLWTYGFRNAMLPVVTTLGMILSFMLGANVLVEKVFAWPGIGSFALESLLASDYAPVQGFILVMATLYVLLNLAIDILYGIIEPRVRIEA